MKPKEVEIVTFDTRHLADANVVFAVGNKHTYVVSKVGGTLTCTCQGYTFRHRCKHVAQAAPLFNLEPLDLL